MRTRPFLRSNAGALVALTLSVGALATVACFSDRSTAAATSTANCTAPASTAGSTVVFISNFAFVPPSIHVKSGQSVAWVNCEPNTTPHTATADGGTFGSPTLHAPDAFVQSFPTTGTFPYHCSIHPFMKATVVVE